MFPGAHCQEYFVRKASSNYHASTHLLCRDPDGDKYKAAVKWNTPVVTREWLFACAASGALVPISKYPVDKDKMIETDNIDIDPLENLRPDELLTKDNGKEVNVKTAQEEIAMETNDPAAAMQVANLNKVACNNGSTCKQPVKRPSIYNRPFRPSFDLTDVMEELASPACRSHSLKSRKSRGSRNSFPLDDFFAENIKQTLQKLGTVAPPTRDDDLGEDDNDETINEVCQGGEVQLSLITIVHCESCMSRLPMNV